VASVGTICGLYVSEPGSWTYVTRGIAEEVAEALKAAGSANGPIPFKGTAVLLYVPWAAKYRLLPDEGYYQVPFRALQPQDVANLFVAGRCISADHDALASTRVMAPSMVLGQAAGTAAALLADDELSVDDLERSLKEQGAFLG
jgi:hypothetical protein